jgi:D-alanyl-D-alanine carboxypeptidase
MQSVEYFFNGTILKNRLTAKSGSMERVRSLAGVFENSKGEEVVFAVIVNNFDGTSYDMAKKLEPLVLELYY